MTGGDGDWWINQNNDIYLCPVREYFIRIRIYMPVKKCPMLSSYDHRAGRDLYRALTQDLGFLVSPGNPPCSVAPSDKGWFLEEHISRQILAYQYVGLMSVGWDVQWFSVSRITTQLARKRLFRWISIKSRLMRAAKETIWSHLTSSRRRYLAEILPWRCKTLSNQSINQYS